MQQAQARIHQCSRWLAWLAGAVILFGCALPVSIDVVSRAITGRTWMASFEISGYAFAACIGLGMGFTVTSKANIRVDVVTARLPRKVRLAFDLIASLSLALVALAFAGYTFDVLAESWKLGARSPTTLQMPLLVPQSLWWLGFVWFATVACLTPVFALERLFRRDLDGAEALVSNPDLDDELADIGIDTSNLRS